MARRPTLQVLEVYDDFSEPEKNVTGAQRGSSPRPEHPASAPQQWLHAACSSAESQCGGVALGELFALLRGHGRQATDRTVPTLNRARALISKVFHFSAPSAAAGPSAAAAAADDPEGPRKARACLYLYQRALHRVLRMALRCAAAAHGLPSPEGLSEAQRDWSIGSVVDQGEMQLGLVHACVEVVNFVHLRSPEDAFPRLTLLLARLHSGLELFQGGRWLVNTLGLPDDDGVPAMPVEVAAYLGQMEARVVEQLAFLPGSSIYQHILALQRHRRASATEEGSGGEKHLLEDSHVRVVLSGFLRAVARLAQARCDVLCDALADEDRVAPALEDEPTTFAFAAAASSLLDWLLNRHLDVLFFQHLSVVVVSCLYFTAKVHGVEGVSMRSLSTLASAILPCHDAATFSQVELLPVQSAQAAGSGGGGEGALSDGSDDECGAQVAVGTCRQFYNSVLLPVLEPHLKAPEDMFGLNQAELKAALAAARAQGCASQLAVNAEPGRQPQDAGAAKAEAGGRAKAVKRSPLGSHQPNTKRPIV